MFCGCRSRPFFFLGEQPRYPPPIAVTNPLAPGVPLKGKELANNPFPFPKVEDQDLIQSFVIYFLPFLDLIKVRLTLC